MNELLIKNVNIIDWCQNFHGDIYIKKRNYRGTRKRFK